jgi:trigger factor
MRTEVRDLEKSKKELSINVDKETFNDGFEKKLKDIKKNAKIPGFRQGTAPDNLVKKYYHNKIMTETLEKVINDATTAALKEQTINPLTMPLIKDVKLEEDNSISFKVQVDVYPQFDVIKYKDFVLTEEIRDITDKDVDEELKALQLRNATYNPKDENTVSSSNDLLTVDILEEIDGIVEESKDFSFVIDNNDFHKEFNEALKGLKKGETKEFIIEYPIEHPDKRFAGKKVKYVVFLKEIKERVLPEINDDFAKEIGESFENLNELKKNIRENLEKNRKIIAKNELTEKILKKIIEENPFEVPDSMVLKQAEAMTKQLLNSYKQLYGEDVIKQLPVDKIIEDTKPKAEFQIKAALIINKITEKEKIAVSDEELEQKLNEYSEKLKKDPKELKKSWGENGMFQTLKDNILIDKAHDFLVSVNKIEKKIISKEENKTSFVEGE